MNLKKIIQSCKEKISSLPIQVKAKAMSAHEVLQNEEGNAILEFVLVAIIVVVLAGSLLEYNTKLFSETVFPKLTSFVSDLFGS